MPRTAVLTGLRQIEILDREVPPPAPGEVALAINAVGICGSDIAYWAKGIAGGFKKLDFSASGLCTGYCGQLGHECAGTVVALGEGVTSHRVGDRVALEPGVPCGGCDVCRRGRYNLCARMRFMGSAVNETPGGMGARFNHPAAFCHVLPPHVSLREGAMLEPLCVALHAARRSRVGMGMRVLIAGAGPIGLMTMLAARAAGAATICVTDMIDSKLELARRLGASRTFRADTAELATAAAEACGGAFDVAFECSGAPPALELCVRAAASGGAVCVVANLPETSSVRLQELARREIELIGTYRYCNLYPTALALVGSGAIDVKPLISRTFALADANAAFEHFASGEPVKVIIEPNEPAGDDAAAAEAARCVPCE